MVVFNNDYLSLVLLNFIAYPGTVMMRSVPAYVRVNTGIEVICVMRPMRTFRAFVKTD